MNFMKNFKKIVIGIIFGLLFLTQSAFAQTQKTHELIAYTMATVLSDDFNVVETTKELSSTLIHMTANYMTVQTAKITVIEKLVRRYSDVRIVYPWSYYDEYLATMLQIQDLKDYEIILLIKAENSVCHLFIGVNDRRTKM